MTGLNNPSTNPSGPHYRVECLDLHAHLYRVSLSCMPRGGQLELALPVWIPGSYLVREFSQHLHGMAAVQGERPVPVRQTRKNRWLIDPLSDELPVVVSWEVYAFDASVRTAWLDARRGFFNGTSLLPMVRGQTDQPHHLTICPPDRAQWPETTGWQCATALVPVSVDAAGFGTYTAPRYGPLVDEPVELGDFWSWSFEVRGIPHRLVVSGAADSFDGDRLVTDIQRICDAEMAMWPDTPFDRYVFLLNATHDGYGGLEHPHSTALIAPRADLPMRPAVPGSPPAPLKASDGYVSLLGLISHEYFHTWNVKRLRPSELADPDLESENLTTLLWWFEGLTSYYDDLILHRAGLIDTATYLALLAKTIQQVAQTPGRHIQSVAQASWEAWTKYYRVQENTPNATVSYYTKGALVGLCLDLTLRQHGSSLDHALRILWRDSGGGPIGEADIRRVVNDLAGRSLDAELDAWVHGIAELPVVALLAQAGVQIRTEAPTLAQRLGLRVQESSGIHIKNVLRGGLAERAGMAAGDEWVALETASGTVWRLFKLDDLPPLVREPQPVVAWVNRDRRIHRLHLQWPGSHLSVDTTGTDAIWHGGAAVTLQQTADRPTASGANWPLALGH